MRYREMPIPEKPREATRRAVEGRLWWPRHGQVDRCLPYHQGQENLRSGAPGAEPRLVGRVHRTEPAAYCACTTSIIAAMFCGATSRGMACVGATM